MDMFDWRRDMLRGESTPSPSPPASNRRSATGRQPLGLPCIRLPGMETLCKVKVTGLKINTMVFHRIFNKIKNVSFN